MYPTLRLAILVQIIVYLCMIIYSSLKFTFSIDKNYKTQVSVELIRKKKKLLDLVKNNNILDMNHH